MKNSELKEKMEKRRIDAEKKEREERLFIDAQRKFYEKKMQEINMLPQSEQELLKQEALKKIERTISPIAKFYKEFVPKPYLEMEMVKIFEQNREKY